MTPADPPAEDPTVHDLGRLLAVLQGLDLTSADGRAGIGSLLSEIERLAPGAVLRQAAGIDLKRLGWRRDASRLDDGRSSSEAPRAER